MPRTTRIDAPDALHHIIIRGIERKKIFRDDTDRDNFLDRLGEILVDTRTACFAWALIPNHVHLLLKTGSLPLATVMRRLLTGYAVSFNLRHRRHGQLFQNRYKSILCQEDPYLLELVRYIHLNPLRAKIVSELKSLDRYPYSGHSIVMGKRMNDWQDVEYILGLFDIKLSTARRRYRAFVQKGLREGRRPDLVGGNLIRSAGGWSIVKATRKNIVRLKGDERILGDADFVERVLESNNERLSRRYKLESRGYDFDWLIERVSLLSGMKPKEILSKGKYPQTVKARSLLCFWATRELGISTVKLAKKLNLSQPSVSTSAKRGEKIAKDNNFKLLEE